MAYLRDRRAFGNIGTRKFRGARFGDPLSPRFSGLLDQYGGAAAAYSLRALSSGWVAGDVVEVRPSSGWTPASFTAGQVANGEMVDYVKRPGNFTNNGFETFANNGTGDGFTATNTVSIGFISASVVAGVSTNVVTIDFDIDIVSGSPALALRSGATASSAFSVISTSGSKSIPLTATGSFDNFAFSEGDIPSEFTISNVRFSTADGFVSTWYDQSGNASDAAQATTTAQPKIVSAGALVVGGLDFDGVDDLLSNGSLTLGATVTGYTVTNSTAKINSSYIFSINGTSGIVDFTDISEFASIYSGTSLKASTDISGSAVLKSSLFNGASSNVRVNGSSVATGNSGAQLANGTLVIGGGGSASDRMLGTINEIIIYGSNQSANTAGIETNINAAYSIF